MVKSHGFLSDFLLLWWTVGDGGARSHRLLLCSAPVPNLIPTTILTAMQLAWMMCKNFKELLLASALRDAHPIMHSHLCMFLSMSSSSKGENAANDEGQFAGMKRSFCRVQVDGVELFLPAGLDSSRVTSGCQVRGESRGG